MSTPNPVLVAAAPSLIQVVEALQTFNANMGTDPLKWPALYPGAFQVLLGSVELLLPGLASSEAGALQSVINTKLSGWKTQLQQIVAQGK